MFTGDIRRNKYDEHFYVAVSYVRTILHIYLRGGEILYLLSRSLLPLNSVLQYLCWCISSVLLQYLCCSTYAGTSQLHVTLPPSGSSLVLPSTVIRSPISSVGGSGLVVKAASGAKQTEEGKKALLIHCHLYR